MLVPGLYLNTAALTDLCAVCVVTPTEQASLTSRLSIASSAQLLEVDLPLL